MDKKARLNKLKREQEMQALDIASLPVNVFEDSDEWRNIFNGLDEDKKRNLCTSLNLQEELAKEDKIESVNEQLLNEIKKLLMEGLTKESSCMLINSSVYQGWGLCMAAIGVGMGAISISIPVFELAEVILYAGEGLAFSGLMLAYSGYMFGKIANEFPEHRNRMDAIGDHKTLFNKVWFEHWRNGGNIPNYRIAILLELTSVLLLVVSALWSILKLVLLSVI